MAEKEALQSIRVDDVPLLYALIQELGICGSINESKKAHGNWVGTSIGDIIEAVLYLERM